MVIRWQEEAQKNVKKLKKIKKNCQNFEFCLHRLMEYYLPSWKLENANDKWLRLLDTYEKRLLEHSFKWFNSKTGDFSAVVHWGFTFLNVNQIRKPEVEKLFLLYRNNISLVWDLRSAIGICDRRYSGYTHRDLKILKDISKVYDELGDSSRFVIVPLVWADKHNNKFKYVYENETEQDSSEQEIVKKVSMAEKPETQIITNDEKAQTIIVDSWADLEVAVLCLVEFQMPGQICLNDLRNIKDFEDKFSGQVKKLKELGIDLKMDKVVHEQQQQSVDGKLESGDIEKDLKRHKKSRKMSEVVFVDFDSEKWRKQPPFIASKLQTLRDPLELTFAFSKLSIVVDLNDLQANITCLDLSDLNLTKLDTIDQFVNLCCLSVSRNKITSVKKISTLKKMIFLDVSSNQISKVEELPELLSDINFSYNALTNVSFCGKLSLLTKLNLSYNKIRSLKGIENNKMLEMLWLTDNQIREKTEIDILLTLPKLLVLDMVGNPVMETEGLLKKILLQNQNLMYVNCERIQNEERRLAIKKAGKALTMDYIEKQVPKVEIKTSIVLKNHDLQTIGLDRTAVAKLQHIDSLDLSWNSLENSNELSQLGRLTHLILAHNSINMLASESEKEAFIRLELLDLSYNHLTNQCLTRLGLTRLTKLKTLILAGNQIKLLDLAVFDLKQLEELDLSQNEIKTIKKKTLNQLKKLDLSWNKLKDIEGLSTPNVTILNITNNKIVTCSGIKSIAQMPKLKELNCVGNLVTERRVYTDFVRNQAKALELLDGLAVNSIQPVLQEVKVRTLPRNGIMLSRSAQNIGYIRDDEWNDPGDDLNPLYMYPSEVLVNESIFKQKPINNRKTSQRMSLSPIYSGSLSKNDGLISNDDNYKFFISGTKAMKYSKF